MSSLEILISLWKPELPDWKGQQLPPSLGKVWPLCAFTWKLPVHFLIDHIIIRPISWAKHEPLSSLNPHINPVKASVITSSFLVRWKHFRGSSQVFKAIQFSSNPRISPTHWPVIQVCRECQWANSREAYIFPQLSRVFCPKKWKYSRANYMCSSLFWWTQVSAGGKLLIPFQPRGWTRALCWFLMPLTLGQ